ncbi:caspase family protein [Phormidium sp. CCY1219]|uniref:caspase family protein n=1 Tax=Phormidium sp. CCY1219 TaxID=2886104 RepID=UPI002D1F9219|nr:caspase family protein [Phormidium sp. CCY1219]MEB3828920.1 caspase family protein [Phormidium sp. CCY1219]
MSANRCGAFLMATESRLGSDADRGTIHPAIAFPIPSAVCFESISKFVFLNNSGEGVMKTYAGILIGIDDYKFFQPLSYAKQDAQGVKNYLVEKAGFTPNRCVLLTETASRRDSHSPYPTRDNLVWAIDDICRNRLHAGDVLWFFFSGYGVSWEGEDYLMPIEGNPEDIPGTGISMRSLYSTLQSCPAEQIVVFLDMNRATGTSADETIGVDTISLAREMEIPTVISCQHNQFSRETAALQHGFFTTTLLEALKAGRGHTLETLAQYMGDRLPQLCEEHFRPAQHPMFSVHPLVKFPQPILPELGPSVPEQNWAAAVPLSAGKANLEPSEETPPQNAPPPTNQTVPPAIAPPTTSSGNGVSTNGDTNNAKTSKPSQPPTATPKPPPPREEKSNTVGKLLFWGGILALILLLGVLLRTILSVMQGTTPEPQVVESLPTVTDEAPQAMETTTIPPTQEQPEAATTEDTEAATPEDTEAATTEDTEAVTTEDTEAATTEDTEAATSEDTEAATTEDTEAANAGDEEAETTTAADDRTQPLSATPASEGAAERGDREPLDRARLSLENTQASQFTQAIAQARQVPENDPLYDQAQEQITRWGEVILDIAMGRAKQGNYEGAIAAAKLVPPDREQLKAQVQEVLPVWEQQYKLEQANRQRLLEAQKLVKPAQASTYSKAIAIASQIPAGQPQYEQARALINRWSDKIFDIAQYRARRRRFSAAIQAAQLIPENTTAYPAAQEAIEKWEQRRR